MKPEDRKALVWLVFGCVCFSVGLLLLVTQRRRISRACTWCCRRLFKSSGGGGSLSDDVAREYSTMEDLLLEVGEEDSATPAQLDGAEFTAEALVPNILKSRNKKRESNVRNDLTTPLL
jgi:hypothetical protein